MGDPICTQLGIHWPAVQGPETISEYLRTASKEARRTQQLNAPAWLAEVMKRDHGLDVTLAK